MAFPTNADIQKIINDCPGRVFALGFDNNRRLLIGYQDGLNENDVTFETVNDVDFVVGIYTQHINGIDVSYRVYYVTETIQWIGIMEPGSEKYRVDPITIL